MNRSRDESPSDEQMNLKPNSMDFVISRHKQQINSVAMMSLPTNLEENKPEPLNVKYEIPKILFGFGKIEVVGVCQKEVDDDIPMPTNRPCFEVIVKRNDNPFKALFEQRWNDFVLLTEELNSKELDAPDEYGNTLLLLSLKMYNKNPDFYSNVVEFLLSYGASPFVKDNYQWSVLDEVVSQTNVKEIVRIFDNMVERKIDSLSRQKKIMDEMIESLPDFEFQLKWEFESSVIPFIKKLAPSDTFVFTKVGKRLRVDYTMAGLKRLKAKRRELSIIYNPIMMNDENSAGSVDFIQNVNWTNGFYTNMFVLLKNSFQEEFDIQEKRLIIHDVLLSSSVQGSLEVKDLIPIENHEKKRKGNGAMRKLITSINLRETFLAKCEFQIFKKTSRPFLFQNYEEYSYKNPSMKIEIPRISKSKSDEKVGFFKKWLKGGESSITVTNDMKITSKDTKVLTWIANDFPLKFSTLLTVLNVLSKSNEQLKKLNEILTKGEISKVIGDKGFPVKIQIPLEYTIKANLQFHSYKFIYYLNQGVK